MSEAAAAPEVAKPSVHERLKAFLSPPDSSSDDNPPASEHADDERADPKANIAPAAEKPQRAKPESDADDDPDSSATREDVETEADDGVDDDAAASDDAQDVETQFSSLNELADAAGLDLEKVMDFQLPVKIDGKEGTASLRDLVKSYQLDGHINQKLASLDNDRKTFEGKRIEAERAAADRLLKLNAGVQTLERALIADFAGVDWDKLRAENPSEFNSKFVAYQQRYAQMQDIARQIGEEQQKHQAAQQARAKAWLEEQRTLLKAKIPEWSDDTRRAKDKAEILDYLKGVGISKEEFEQLGDHRYALVVRDAWKWAALQKSKPATLKKVKAAPKLLKPGTKQSRESRAEVTAKQDRQRLRTTGKVRDAVPNLKRAIFGTAQR